MQDQANTNYDWFRQRLPDLLASHRGQHALLHNENLAGLFISSMDAIRAGMLQFGEGNFSVEPIDDRVEDLGFFSHVSAALRA